MFRDLMEVRMILGIRIMTALLLAGAAGGGLWAMVNGNVPLQETNKASQEGSPYGPLQLAKNMLPAAKSESPEEAQMKKNPPPTGRPENIRPASKAELLDSCSKHPGCRKKLDAAQKGEKPAPRPAATQESPEEQQLKKNPPPTVAPRGELSVPVDTLLSSLNPFRAGLAQAQTAFSVTLTPQNNVSNTPYVYFSLFGSDHQTGGWHGLSGHLTISSYTNTETKPYLFAFAQIPTTGWYIINVKGHGRGVAKLRHLYGGPIIETWDMSTQTCSPCDYATMEYLQAGVQQFYFWSMTYQWITQLSIQSFP
jgi:hypothetical protein